MLTGLGRIALGLGAVAIGALAAGRRPARPDLRRGTATLDQILRQHPQTRKKPPEAGLAVAAVVPGGPRPKQGGAAAPIETGR